MEYIGTAVKIMASGFIEHIRLGWLTGKGLLARWSNAGHALHPALLRVVAEVGGAVPFSVCARTNPVRIKYVWTNTDIGKILR